MTSNVRVFSWVAAFLVVAGSSSAVAGTSSMLTVTLDDAALFFNDMMTQTYTPTTFAGCVGAGETALFQQRQSGNGKWVNLKSVRVVFSTDHHDAWAVLTRTKYDPEDRGCSLTLK